MTTPFERTRALVQAGDFLEELRRAPAGAVSDELRRQVEVILRHYPSNMEIGWMAEARLVSDLEQHLDPAGVPREIRGGYRR